MENEKFLRVRYLRALERFSMAITKAIKKDDFDEFADKLKACEVEYVHPVKEHAWGQRVVRIYDPDRHIIEVGENLKTVCKRFLNSGMTPEQTAERMDVPVKFVNACVR